MEMLLGLIMDRRCFSLLVRRTYHPPQPSVLGQHNPKILHENQSKHTRPFKILALQYCATFDYNKMKPKSFIILNLSFQLYNTKATSLLTLQNYYTPQNLFVAINDHVQHDSIVSQKDLISGLIILAFEVNIDCDEVNASKFLHTIIVF